MNNWLMALLLGITLIFASCSNSITDTSSGSEVTNGFIGTIDDGQMPVTASKVFLVNCDKWMNNVLNAAVISDSTLTDSLGRFRFDGVARGRYSIICGTGDSIALIAAETVDNKVVDLGAHARRRSGSLRGRIASDKGTVTRIAAQNTHWSTIPDSSGNFSFQSLPSDSITLYAIVENTGRSLHYTMGRVIPSAGSVDVALLQVVTNGFLLDNFDDGDSVSNIDWFTKRAKWYAYTDADNGGNSKIEPVSILADVTSAYTEIGAYSGKSLSAQFILGDNLAGPYASVACRLGTPAQQYISLEKMSGCAFSLKGKGKIRINFITATVDNYQAATHRGDFGITIEGTDSWSEQYIDISQLTPEPGTEVEADGVLWSSVADSVRALVIGSWALPGDTVSIMVDNIRFYGIPAEEFGKK